MTDVDVVRTLIPDTEAVFGDSGSETLFNDTDIGNFLLAGGNSVLRAAGLACLAIGTSEALISKVIRTQDLQTDGAKLSDAMVKKADLLFRRADKIELSEQAYFQIVDYGWGTYPPELTEPDLSTHW